MVEIEEVYIEPFEQKRRLHIYIPDNIEENERFPVMYMFDGHNLFDDNWATYGTSWGLEDYFNRKNIRMMIVGLECNHEGNERLIEFSPYDYNGKYGLGDCKGKQLFEWMTTDLKKIIDDNYPTLPHREHTFIGGSSMGGIMALYGAIVHNDVYSCAAALSPHHPYCMKELLHDCKRELDPNTRIYISWGSEESGTKQQLAKWTNNNLRIVRELNEKAVVYPQFILGASHCEACWRKETPLWIRALEFYKYKK